MGVGRQKRKIQSLGQLSLFHGQQPGEAVVRGEQLYGNLMASLGQPGTYSQHGVALPGGATIKGGGKGDGTGFETVTAQEQGYGMIHGDHEALAKARQLDPDAMASLIKGGTQFQIASQMTAEAQQLIQREGPLYEQYKKSLHGPLMQRASRQLEDTMDQLNRDFARGGSARSGAVKSALKMQAPGS